MGETKTTNHNKNGDKFLSQVVVRHLPPTMTAEQFKNEISPVPDHNYFHLLKADLSLGQWAFTRACINFTKKDDIFVFKDKFDGYVFVDSNGTEFPAIVEFSPYQKVPRRRVNTKGEPLSCKQRDAKCGTIEEDADYKTFIENLNDSGSQKNLPSAEVYLEEIEAREKELKANHGVIKVTTPLIEFIRQKKAEKLRLKEERREERRRQQIDQKRARDDDHKKDDKTNTLQFKVKQRERKNKAKEGNITVAKNEKRERDREKEKEKDKDKDKDKEKEKKKPKEKPEKEKPKQLLEKEKSSPPERSEKERERKRERNRRKDRENKDGGNDKNKASGSNNDRDQEKEGEKEAKKEKNRFFVVTYSGEKGGNGRNHDSNRRNDSMGNKHGSQQSSSSRMEISHNGDDEPTRRESETCEGQSSVNHSENMKSSNKKSDNQRVRNKDRPALEIYRPRRARNSNNNTNGSSESNDHHDSENNNNNKPERNMRKTKVFTRTRNAD
ncbi:regulator of nonsense transcripts 3B-like [Panonychus citri]|uniref:regulator of nonsense transcripts 3B-like n=1 Tax=Panonychus citri TaxID=50023 RepID=UPI002307E09C|nr:regulator of nonsense transcripts 3B-like [Panonychus citri]